MSYFPYKTTVENVAELRAFNVQSLPVENGIRPVVETLGHTTAGDGGGAEWFWDAASTATDNTGTVINPTANAGAGRWLNKDYRDTGVIQTAWFGVKADANVKRATDNTMWTDTSYTTPATDNTAALRACFDEAFLAGTSAWWNANGAGTITSGYRIGHPVVQIQTGPIYVANATSLLDDTRVTPPAGVRTGFVIQGKGKGNTVLHVRQAAPAAGDWVFNDDNLGVFWHFSDFSIQGVTEAEQIFNYAGSGGYGQNWSMDRVNATGNKVFRYGGGNLQTDKTRFYDCAFAAVGASGGYCWFIDGNNQAVGNSLFGCHATATGAGNAIIRATFGQINWFGGNCEVFSGATVIDAQSNPHGLDLNMNTVSMHAVRTEIHDSSTLCTVSGTEVKFFDTAYQSFSANTGNVKVQVNSTGKVRFVNCWVGDDMRTALVTTPAGGQINEWRAAVEVDGGYCTPGFLANVTYWEDEARTIPFGTIANRTGIGRAVVHDAKQRDGVTNVFGVQTITSPNGSPFAWRGSSTETARDVTVITRAPLQDDAGLPAPGDPCRVVIPANCLLKTVRICKGPTFVNGGTLSWRVVDLDGTEYCRLTVASSGEVKVSEMHVYKVVTTINQRTLQLEAVGGLAGHYAEGFAEVTYV